MRLIHLLSRLVHCPTVGYGWLQWPIASEREYVSQYLAESPDEHWIEHFIEQYAITYFHHYSTRQQSSPASNDATERHWSDHVHRRCE